MTINRAISRIMRDMRFTQQRMAEATGRGKANAVGARLSTRNLTFDTAVEMLNVLGYEVVVQPKSTGRRKDGAILIDQKEE